MSHPRLPSDSLDRREVLRLGLAGLSAVTVGHGTQIRAEEPEPDRGRPTEFLLACMTLPYAAFPLERALQGIQSAGFRHVAWGTTHVEAGRREAPVLAPDASPEAAKALAARCRDMGLEPVLMFSTVYPEAPGRLDVLKQRIRQAAAAGVRPGPDVRPHARGATAGSGSSGSASSDRWLATTACSIVVKQHGGATGTGAACAEIVREVGDDAIKVNYDAGNVMDYLDLDPIPDIKACADEVRSFCIKDHRNFPKDQDCGPGFGEIDHYRLLQPVAFTGRTMPLCCENIFAPVIPRPDDPSGVDALARRAREFLEVVIRGLHAV